MNKKIQNIKRWFKSHEEETTTFALAIGAVAVTMTFGYFVGEANTKKAINDTLRAIFAGAEDNHKLVGQELHKLFVEIARTGDPIHYITEDGTNWLISAAKDEVTNKLQGK